VPLGRFCLAGIHRNSSNDREALSGPVRQAVETRPGLVPPRCEAAGPDRGCWTTLSPDQADLLLAPAAGHTGRVPEALCPVVVGRDAETSVLQSALAAVRGGAGGLVFVTGEPGIGKSRLAREVADQARAHGMTVIAGRAVPASASTPYRPLTEALLQALRNRGLPADPDLAPWLPALRSIIPAGSGDSQGDHSPAVRGEAVLRLLRRLAQPGSLVILLEDLHWADPDSLAVIEYLGDNLSSEPVLCVATTRSEPPSAAMDLALRLHRRRSAAHLPLGRLGDEHVAAMVRACLPEAADDTIARVQRTADGVPFLVEELLASPGVPRSFADSVRARLTRLGDDECLVLRTAAVLGRQFDWRLLPVATGLPASVVSGALERGADSMLLSVDGGTFRFRHALTREAVAGELFPTQRSAVAERALAAVEAAHPGLPGPWRDFAADLAAQSGDRERAGVLLVASGRASLGRGALATAIDTLVRAGQLLADAGARAEADALLVEALGLAGRVDEAMKAGERLITQLGQGGAASTARAEVHLRLAHAAVDATRWVAATVHLDTAKGMLTANPQPGLSARAATLEAEVAFADNDVGQARRLAESVLATEHASPDVRCHALELLGRIQRINDLGAARDTFESALALADTSRLSIWRLRALHELGTIEMFDHAGTERLIEARRSADDLGAVSTGAVIDLQLCAALMFRFALDEAAQHARSALVISQRLGLAKVRAIVLLFLGEIHALRRENSDMERFLTLADSAAPGDPEIEGSAWAGGRGMLALLDDDWAGALGNLGRGIAILDTLPQQGPASYRGMWPLLLSAVGDTRAAAAIAEARQIGVTVNRANRGLLGYADAILTGRTGDRQRATELARAADGELVHYPVWADLARLCTAERALADGWGEPVRWLEAGAQVFAAHGIDPLAERCRRLLAGPRPSRWTGLGITEREADVLRLVAEGLANKEIAARLRVSPRTIEKHVESLLRKTAARSRTQLVAVAGPESRTIGSP
jgi:DNA-binding CsgD family transcriptional regulator/tetratricopeptide (TPR) repeat protein